MSPGSASAGVDFEDVRLKRADWIALKPTTPFGSIPLLELPGRPPLAQSNAILVYIGRQYGLHPKDDFEAVRHESMMSHVEDLRANVMPTLRTVDHVPASIFASHTKLTRVHDAVWEHPRIKDWYAKL